MVAACLAGAAFAVVCVILFWLLASMWGPVDAGPGVLPLAVYWVA